MNISNSELNLMEIIWEKEPVKSGELVSAAYNTLGWKKSTVYTVIKKLTGKGLARSENAVVTSLVDRNNVFSEKSENLINTAYGGSLPMFLTAFLNKERLTRAEAEELKRLIDERTEDK